MIAAHKTVRTNMGRERERERKREKIGRERERGDARKSVFRAHSKFVFAQRQFVNWPLNELN